MVNDSKFEDPQIPVTVDGKTYFGCCQGCVRRLNKDRKIRNAVDPVSRDTVDKATAVIGVAPDGRAYYFESRVTLRAFDPAVHGAKDDS